MRKSQAAATTPLADRSPLLFLNLRLKVECSGSSTMLRLVKCSDRKCETCDLIGDRGWSISLYFLELIEIQIGSYLVWSVLILRLIAAEGTG
jgi:hypothetical protein